MRSNDWRATAALAAFAAASFAAFAHAQGQTDAKAAAVVTETRKALGGEQKIATLKTLSLRADYRREMGAMAGGGGSVQMFMMAGPAGGHGGPGGGGAQMTGKIEIDLALPDRYLRSDVGGGGFTLTRTEGFEGVRPFIEVTGNSPGMRVMAESPAADPTRSKLALKRSNAELARLLLGLVGTTQPNFPVTYAYGGVAESPDGKADIIDVTGPEDFKVRMYVDTESHLPLMLTYMEAEPRIMTRSFTRDGSGAPGGGQAGTRVAASGGGHTVVGRGDAPELSPEQRAELEKARKEAEATPPKMVEYKLFFSDYKKVDGLSMPHRIARGTGDQTVEEWDVTSYKVNPTFKGDHFKVGS
jgi:hypothetical protein